MADQSSRPALQQVIGQVRYKPGWSFALRSGNTMAAGSCRQEYPFPAGSTSTAMAWVIPQEPLFLVICARVRDSGGGGEISVEHLFPVPLEGSAPPWHRWLLDRILDVERHEACEFFQLGGERPFYPEHGPGAQPYAVTERSPA